MLTILPETAGLIAFEADGRIDEEDVDRAIAHTNERLVQNDRVSMLAVVRNPGLFTPQAMIKDIRYAVRKVRDLSRFQRIAVVTDSGPIRALVNLEEVVVPRIELKVFSLDDQDLARQWAVKGLARPEPEEPADF